MSYLALWLDHQQAKVYKFNPDKMEVQHLENKHPDHGHNKNPEHIKKFYKEVSEGLQGAQEILLIGPGAAKTEFKKYLDEHHQAKMAKAIVGIEACDHHTDGEVKNIAKKYFHKYHLFN